MGECKNANCSCNRIYFKEDEYISPGDIITLGRFESRRWKMGFGWYSFGGNRPFMGWYMTSQDEKQEVRPLQQPDLNDIVVITRGGN